MTAEMLTRTSSTYVHQLPTGELVTFKVKPSRYDSRYILVTYPDDVDLSRYRTGEAYPIHEIAEDWGAFHYCEAHGSDNGQCWELWHVR